MQQQTHGDLFGIRVESCRAGILYADNKDLRSYQPGMMLLCMIVNDKPGKEVPEFLAEG